MARFSKCSKLVGPKLLGKPHRLDQDDRVLNVDSQPRNVSPRKQPTPIEARLDFILCPIF
jgi:hypothetical protein